MPLEYSNTLRLGIACVFVRILKKGEPDINYFHDKKR